MSFKEFIKELNGNRVEGELLKTIIISLAVSFTTLLVLYQIRLKGIENFIPKYGFYIFFSILSYAIILPSVRQVRSYRAFPCMSGMMIGMTIGMMSGFLAGFYLGATNGMFWGSVFGMIIGIMLGVWTGKSCGVMGVMEGIMAGFMGSLMGAMTAVMMYNDNLKAAGAIMFIVCGAIILGLNYMLYQETKETERELREDHMFTIIASFVLTVVTIWLMVFGPRSVLFQ